MDCKEKQDIKKQTKKPPYRGDEAEKGRNTINSTSGEHYISGGEGWKVT